MDYLMDEYMTQHLLDEVERKRKGVLSNLVSNYREECNHFTITSAKRKTPKKKKRQKEKTSLHYCALGINISFFFTFSSKFQFIVSHWMREADVVYSCDCVRMVRHSTSIN